MIDSIYISRNEQEVPLLMSFAGQHGIRVTAQSQIRFDAVDNQPKSKTEVIFFSSIRAAEYFLKNQHIAPGVNVATIGISTANKLSALGIQSDFIGEKAGDPEQVAKDFNTWLNGRKVLIPCSASSNRSIAVAVPKTQVEELIVYRTLSDCKPVNPHTIYVFTSPSNFKAFQECNQLPMGSKVIAWGSTTQKALNSAGIDVLFTLESSTEEELLTFLSTN